MVDVDEHHVRELEVAVGAMLCVKLIEEVRGGDADGPDFSFGKSLPLGEQRIEPDARSVGERAVVPP